MSFARDFFSPLPDRPLVKFCGFTHQPDVELAVELGADLIGLNFWPASSRAIPFALGARLREASDAAAKRLGRSVKTAAILVNPERAFVRQILRDVKPDILQFHGDESPEFCRLFEAPFIKAFRPQSLEIVKTIASYEGPHYLGYLLDGARGREYGGTGTRVSISLARDLFARLPHGFLAGGLNPQNVREATATTLPFGVDAASGIESRPGVKHGEQMLRFIKEVEAAGKPIKPKT